jgi:hypothetical protein
VDFGNIANEAYEIAAAVLSWLDNHNGAVTAIFTGFVAWFTYELYKANKLAIDHTRTIERAYVKMSHMTPGLQFGSNNMVVPIAVKNFGKTPARISKVVLKAIALSRIEKLPEVPDYSNSQVEHRIGAFLVSDDETFVYGNMQLDPNAIFDAQQGQKRLTVFGYIDYIDQFKVRHRGGYAREYDSGLKNLIYVTQPRYNYDRVRRSGEGDDWGEIVS